MNVIKDAWKTEPAYMASCLFVGLSIGSAATLAAYYGYEHLKFKLYWYRNVKHRSK